MNRRIAYTEVLAGLDPVWPEDPIPEIRDHILQYPGKVFILDDDPTGTQTVRGLHVVTRWDTDTLARQWDRDQPGCFILTNSRALTEAATLELHQELAANLTVAADGRPFSVISRSDSTLRGHFDTETRTLATALGGMDLLVIAPFFKAGGRLTVSGTHYILEEDVLRPVDDTEFARDPAFPFKTSYLPAYVEEKTGGRIPAENVRVVPLSLLRRGGPMEVYAFIRETPPGSVLAVDSIEDRDMEVFVAGALMAEREGRKLLYRSAAALVAARVGQTVPPLLNSADLRSISPHGGLVVAGSHVPKTTAQLTALKQARELKFIELSVPRLLENGTSVYVEEVSQAVNSYLASGTSVVLQTSRDLVTGSSREDSLGIGSRVSGALVQIVKALNLRPRFLIAKGGITSSDIATQGLGVKDAMIKGQILPGVPVWETGPESRFPGMSYIVFPGNVGGPDALLEATRKLLD